MSIGAGAYDLLDIYARSFNSVSCEYLLSMLQQRLLEHIGIIQQSQNLVKKSSWMTKLKNDVTVDKVNKIIEWLTF